MANRRTKKRQSGHRDGPESAEQMLDRVIGAFDHWLCDRETDPARLAALVGIARVACELKGSYLGEPNPADWNPHIAVELVGEVFPHKVVGVDDSLARDVVPAMLTYLEFLVTTGRWKPYNDSFATRRALSSLEAKLPGRFADSAPQSMAGRMMQLARERGVDPIAPGAIDGFVQRSNDMPLQWRKQLTDGPGAASLAAVDPVDNPYGSWDGGRWADGSIGGPLSDDWDGDGLLDDPEVDAALQAAAFTSVAALGFTPGEAVSVTVPDADSELAALLATPLLSRIRALSEWARPGRRLTSTGAMRRADATAWLTEFGITAASNSSANSMWDWPELAVPWSIAQVCGMIDVSGTTAGPGASSALFDSTDLQAQIDCARTVVDMLIAGLLDEGDEPNELDVVVALTLVPALALMCRPEGVDLAAFRALADSAGSPAEDFDQAVIRILVSVVSNIIVMLEAWGFATEAGGRTSVPVALRPALVQAIYSPDAPFAITLGAGAIPLRDDETLFDEGG